MNPGNSGSAWPRVTPLILALTLLTASAARGDSRAGAAEPDGGLALHSVAAMEYAFSAHGDGTWSAPNRSQNLRGSVGAEGLRLQPRTGSGSWVVGLSLTGIGRGEAVEAPGAVTRVSGDGSRVDVRRAGLVEWFVNEPTGLEHGFTLDSPPAGAERDEPLLLSMRLSGATASLESDRRGARFRTSGGSDVVRYAGLAVFDATGRDLEAWLETDGSDLRIRVDDRNAAYPLRIDPVATNPDWSSESGQMTGGFGVSVASAGDVNGDGYDDVIVGANLFDNGEIDEGKVFVFHGTEFGIEETPAWTAEGDFEGAFFGAAVGSAGDVNGDGIDDVIIGANGYENGNVFEGAVFVYYGSLTNGLSGPDGTRISGTPANADWSGEGDQDYADYGISVASGDVNDDGFSDVIVGVDEYSNGHSFEGTVLAYYGSSPNGLAGPSGTRNPGSPANADWAVESGRVDTDFGFSIGVGNFNGDLYDDVVIGSWNYDNTKFDEGRAYLFKGDPGGLQTIPVWVRDGGIDGIRFGISIASAGDVNGDGFDDVIVGADGYRNGIDNEGGALLFYGTSTAILSQTPAWIGEGEQGDSTYGYAVAGVGDVNSDGYDDVVVGAQDYDNGQLDEGRAFLYLGTDQGLTREAVKTAEVDQDGAQFGRSVAAAGDVNSDGYADFIVGADFYTKLVSEEGGAFAYLGCSDDDRDGVCLGLDNCPNLANPDQEDADFDFLGDFCDPCTDADLDLVCDGARVLVQWDGPAETVLVQFGSSMRYLANEVDPNIVPPLGWVSSSFVDDSWPVGTYGVGYETDAGGAHDLIQTNVPSTTASVYTRSLFVIDDLARVRNIFFAADFDDGVIAWINGTEVFRSGEMPADSPLWNTTAESHESSNSVVPEYGSEFNISDSAMPVLVQGVNTLAVGVWNTTGVSSDLVVVPRLSINRTEGKSISYRANATDTGIPSTWTSLGYDDRTWDRGTLGIGYEAATGAELLTNTTVPSDTVSIYARATFDVAINTVQSMFISGDYDDGYVAWINGNEVFRSPEMPGSPGEAVAWNAPATSHESSNGPEPVFGTLTDITSVGVPALLEGTNVLALGVWNAGGVADDDLVIVPRLSINDDHVDNCLGVFNPDQIDTDGDTIGDACDPDDDDDTIPDDGDGSLVIGDNPCTGGATTDCDDNCRIVSNPAQLDQDGDFVGDACDTCPDDPSNDIDNDQICAGVGFAAPKIGDQDNCPNDFNDDQADLDLDGLGDVCDPDVDGDSVLNGSDNCPLVDNPLQENDDGDQNGNACDCNIADNAAWEAPSPVLTLALSRGVGTDDAVLTWQAPALGGSSAVYDVLRSTVASDFDTATCVETNDVDLTATDTTAEQIAFYLVRVENLCPASALAPETAGTRSAVSCD